MSYRVPYCQPKVWSFRSNPDGKNKYMKQYALEFHARGLFVLCLGLLTTFSAPGQQAKTGPIVIEADSHDTSRPVREMIPGAPQIFHRVAPLGVRRLGPIVDSEPDPVVQRFEDSATQLVRTTNLANFDGIADRDNDAPPDTNASVGQTQVVETVNVSFQVFNKSGGSIFGPAGIATIFSGLAGVCGSATSNFSDPVALYDKLANRWLITIIASSDGFATGSECIAVSTTNDATGAYHRYSFSLGSTSFGDYPKFGVWPDAYYASYNVFNRVGYVGGKACAYNRTHMLAGGSAQAHCFKNPNEFSFLPSDLDGAGLFTSGEPNFFVELDPTGGSALHLFKFHVDFAVPANTTFTGPTILPVASFSAACGGNTCIPQAGTSQQLDALSDRLMFRLAYRAFPADHESLVVTHSVKGTGGVASAARWYEIRSPGTAPVLWQQGSFSSGSLSLWMGSIAMDKAGNIALGYSESSSATHPSIAYTGRGPTDAPGTMASPSTILTGTASQTGGLSRWGDYSSMSIDPVDDCTFWYAQEYQKTDGIFNWHTRLASFKFTTCQ